VPGGDPGSTPGADPWSQGVIPRRFKQKKIFVTDARTDRRVGRNSYLDSKALSVSFNLKYQTRQKNVRLLHF